MPRKDYYAPGQNNVACDQCGFKYKSNELRKQWDGIWVCDKCDDPRNPQELLRGIKDNMAPALSRPRPPPQFIDVHSIYEDE